MRLAGKVAIVTGGSRGIGRRIAGGLAGEGAKVVICYAAQRTAADEVLAQIRAAGGEAIAVQADVSRKGDVERLVQTTLANHDRIDVLVNVAGIAHFVDFFQTTEQQWDEQFAVNARGMFLLSQAVARQMVKQGGGKIVNVTSVSGEKADPQLVAYCASKGAANMLTKAMAAALGPYNIEVNAVLPGTTVTDMNRARLKDARLSESITALTPLGRLGRPDDLVGAVLYLASPEADWTTGALLVVDGGFLA